MALQKENKYWKIVEISVDRTMNRAVVRMIGFKDKEESTSRRHPFRLARFHKKAFHLFGEEYPFIEETPNVGKTKERISQVAFCYQKVKVDKFFEGAEDC